MRRREFIVSLCCATVGWSRAVTAEIPATPVIGYLSGGWSEPTAHLVTALHAGLEEAGYAEGRSVAFEYRWAEGHTERLPNLASDLVGRGVTLIIATTSAAAVAAGAATKTIPILDLAVTSQVSQISVARSSRRGSSCCAS